MFFDFLAKSNLKFVQGLCQFKDLLTRVLKLGDSINAGGSLSKNTARRMSTNKSKPTVSDAFRLQLAVLVDVLQVIGKKHVALFSQQVPLARITGRVSKKKGPISPCSK